VIILKKQKLYIYIVYTYLSGGKVIRMEEQGWVKFSSPLVKVGNSYSLRVPMPIVKMLKADEGNMIVAKAKKFVLNWSPEIMDLWFKLARKCSELKKFSDEKVILLSMLAFNAGKSLMASAGDRYEFMDQGKAALKMREALRAYNKKILEDYGKKVYDDYLYFQSIVQPVMQRMSKRK